MIPYRGDRFDHFNNGQPVNRHMVHFPQQQQPQILQPQSLMYSAPTYQFRQPYLGNMPMQQQTLMFVQSRPRPQQSWILSSGPPQSTPFMSPSQPTFNQIQPPLPPQQQSFSGEINIQQPSFSGGTGVNYSQFSGGICMSQSSFSGGGNNVSQPLLNCGTGIPQPSFSGGTGVLKRKSHYLEEPDYDLPTNSTHDNNRELPSLMNISTQSYNNNQPQQKHNFQHANPRYMGNTNTILRLPPTPQGSCMPPPPPTESFNNQLPHPHWTNSDRNMYPMPPQMTRSTQH
ncbi:unnamed protein product, partial [Rotaria magnacalcarata]